MSTKCPEHGTRDASGDFTCRTCGATWDFFDGSEHPAFPIPCISIPVVRHLRSLAESLQVLADRMAAAEKAGKPIEVTGAAVLAEIDRGVFTLSSDLTIKIGG